MKDIKEIEKLAEEAYEGCDGCTAFEKQMWIEGFVRGYLANGDTWVNEHPKVKDEWGNVDWRDTGEMGG